MMGQPTYGGMIFWTDGTMCCKKEIKMTNIPTIEIDEYGNIHTLYTDEIDLFCLGKVTNVRKASNVEFNETQQVWEVLSLDGEVLHTHKHRDEAISWEIEMFSPSGPLYNPKGDDE